MVESKNALKLPSDWLGYIRQAKSVCFVGFLVGSVKKVTSHSAWLGTEFASANSPLFELANKKQWPNLDLKQNLVYHNGKNHMWEEYICSANRVRVLLALWTHSCQLPVRINKLTPASAYHPTRCWGSSCFCTAVNMVKSVLTHSKQIKISERVRQ